MKVKLDIFKVFSFDKAKPPPRQREDGPVGMAEGLAPEGETEEAVATATDETGASTAPELQEDVPPQIKALRLCERFRKINYILINGYPIEPRLLANVGKRRAEEQNVMPLVYLGRQNTLFLSNEAIGEEQRTALSRSLRKSVMSIVSPEDDIEDLRNISYEYMENRSNNSIRLGEILTREGLIDESLLQHALNAARAERLHLGEYLIRHGHVEEEKICEILSMMAEIPLFRQQDLARTPPDVEIVKSIPVNYARWNQCIPFRRDGEQIKVLVVDPNQDLTELFSVYGGSADVTPVLTTTTVFAQVFREQYGETLAPGFILEQGNDTKGGGVEDDAPSAPGKTQEGIENPDFLEKCILEEVLGVEDLQAFESECGKDTLRILSAMVEKGYGDKDTLGRIWGDTIGKAYINLDKTMFMDYLIQRLPESFARRNRMILIYEFGQEITAAMVNPNDGEALRQAEKLVGSPIMGVFSLPEEIAQAIEIGYRSEDKTRELLDNLPLPDLGEDEVMTEEVLSSFGSDEAVVEFTRSILLLGLKMRASDIHIEPAEHYVSLRYRIDGALQEFMKFDSPLLLPVVSRLKILAQLNIVERRVPQDGRIGLELQDRRIDFRFSTVPTIYGEKVCLRILGQLQRTEVPDLEELGFSQRNYQQTQRIIGSPTGIFLVTGPTGSGKSTTLYAIMKKLNQPDVNVMTAEDPVEYRLNGINQVQVHHQIGVDFNRILRAFLRQDPDIILVGEIRDQETARTATEAALTGHLVMASMHTNSALGAVTRLIEIGVERYLVGPSLSGVMAQRLVRRLCDDCKAEHTPKDYERFEIVGGDVSFYRPTGCASCRHIGYRGRIALHEVFAMTDAARAAVIDHAPEAQLEALAWDAGFRDLRHDAIKKLLRGLTSLKEINRVTVSASQEEDSCGSGRN